VNKILYISPQNTAGTLTYWKKFHEEMGNECRYITFYRSKSNYPDDICLNLPFVGTNKLFSKIRESYYKFVTGNIVEQKHKEGFPPKWSPNNLFETIFFRIRDFIWYPIINNIIKKHKLYDYDIYHFEWGEDLFRFGGFASKLKKKGKPIICHYHGTDMRNRGVIPHMDEISDLNLTNEPDLMLKHPSIEYLFLPFDVTSITPRTKLNSKLKICHATTNRWNKGSDFIINICEKLEKELNFEFVLIEGKTHSEALKIKSECDINIDHVSTEAGWGYGMNSIEAMAQGLCPMVHLVADCEHYFPNHPFINISAATLKTKIEFLIENPKVVFEKGQYARKWVLKHHHYSSVGKKLYSKYNNRGWLL
jgi:hypothetical protein